MENKILAVYWIDAAFTLDEDLDTIESWLEKGGEYACTVGFLYKSNEKCVIIAQEAFEDGSFRGLTIIPKGMITEVKKLKQD